MTKKRPTLGDSVEIDVNRLLVTRLLLQANSGGGKSYALRRLLEQTHGACQQIVIDPDGEFHTLREKYDYVLAGKGGDCAATVRTAPLLARRLLELGVSAIVDIYDLGADRPAFVAEFIGALMDAPRELWHPVMVVVDEAHKFAPETGKRRRKREAATMDDCTAAVISLMDSGRKRGFCGVLATQRIAKLSKDAVAEVNSKLIGRTSYPDDQQRAADELGIRSKEQRLALRDLKPGEFYVFGPAFTVDAHGELVTRVKIGKVETTHPEAGEAAPPPTPPREKIRSVLGELKDLPQEAEDEAKSIGDLQTKVKKLEADLRAAQKAQPKTETKTVEKPVIKEAQLARIEKLIERGEKLGDRVESKLQSALAEATGELDTWRAQLGQDLNQLRAVAAVARQPVTPTPSPAKTVAPSAVRRVVVRHVNPDATNVDLPKGEALVLRALIQYPNGLRKEQLGVLTTFKRSTRDAYVQRLRERGFVQQDGDRVVATQEGFAAMPNVEPLPTGQALREFWDRELPSGEQQVLALLCEFYPSGVDKEHIDEVTGFARSTRDAYLQRLAAKELVVDVGRGSVKASDNLFEVES